jgi:FKBP-type peptidyl-prolyl cis-trans isomerase FkpA
MTIRLSRRSSQTCLRATAGFSLVLVLTTLVAACKSDSPTAPSANVPFSFTDLRVGTGDEATNGRAATVNYALWLYDAGAAQNKGRAVDAGQFSFTVGTGVVTGFSQGVVGMRVGGQRRIIVPPELGYGAAGRDPVPGNATLVFEVELVSLQ